MTTEQLIWFIDSRFYYQAITLDKIVHLANTHKKQLKIIIDASTQSTGHGYWHLLNDNDALSAELMTSIDKKQTQLLKFFSMNAIKVEVTINQSTDYLTLLNTEVTNNANSLVVIEDNIVSKRHPIFQQLTNINASVLLLKNKRWKQPVLNSSINILAAIDPLHENARPEKIDDNIVSLAKNWADILKAKFKIAHCCYVSSVLTQYKNKVLTIHREGFHDFAKKNHLQNEQCVFLEGMPEEALLSYIHQYHTDILIMGLVARNKLEQLWIGSTTTALLNSPPCDMLLIKH